MKDVRTSGNDGRHIWGAPSNKVDMCADLAAARAEIERWRQEYTNLAAHHNAETHLKSLSTPLEITGLVERLEELWRDKPPAGYQTVRNAARDAAAALTAQASEIVQLKESNATMLMMLGGDMGTSEIARLQNEALERDKLDLLTIGKLQTKIARLREALKRARDWIETKGTCTIEGTLIADGDEVIEQADAALS